MLDQSKLEPPDAPNGATSLPRCNGDLGATTRVRSLLEDLHRQMGVLRPVPSATGRCVKGDREQQLLAHFGME